MLIYGDPSSPIRVVIFRSFDESIERVFDFDAGYVLRAADQVPLQGTRRPWRLAQNYPLD